MYEIKKRKQSPEFLVLPLLKDVCLPGGVHTLEGSPRNLGRISALVLWGFYKTVGSEGREQREPGVDTWRLEVEDRETNSLKAICTATPGHKSLKSLMPHTHLHSSEDGLQSGSC